MAAFFKAVKALIFGWQPTLEELDGKELTQAGETPVLAEDQPQSTVLAIDDDKSMLDSLRGMLRAEGFAVITANSGPKGLELLRFAPKNLEVLLLDYNMPGYNGAETLAHVRKLRPNVKIVAVTGADINRLPPEFREGVDKLVLKPFKSSELIGTIRGLTPPAAAAA
ncbi:MAG: response regulator [Verrucomicrobiota bacterium]